MSTINGPSAPGEIPEALCDEDGGSWSLLGHVDPAMAVLAVVRDQMLNVDAASAAELLTGASDPVPWHVSQRERIAHSNALLAAVRHFWFRPHPDDEERLLVCDPDHPAAEAWTVVRP